MGTIEVIQKQAAGGSPVASKSESGLRVVPKPDAEQPVLRNFAVQALRGESYREVAQVVLQTAESRKELFRKLEVMGIMTVGTAAFVRFRADVADVHRVCKGLERRAYIVEVGGTYTVSFVDGRTGKVPATTMCLGPQVGFGMSYAGPKIVRWKQQFVRV